MSSDVPSVSNAVTAFLSYAHRTEAEDDEVLALADRLRGDGVDAMIDRYVQHPREGWAKWMEGQYNQTQYVIVVISPRYVEEFNQTQQSSSGARFEGALLSALLLSKGVDYSRLAAVIMRPQDNIDLPPILSSCPRYYICRPDGYEQLYRFLTKQPHVSVPALGAIKRLPSRPAVAKGELASIGPVPTFQDLCSHLLPTMIENKRMFEDFGPKSGANAGGVRWNTSLWQRMRREKVVLANANLRELIQHELGRDPTRIRANIPQTPVAY
jgi:hypothetical protein